MTNSSQRLGLLGRLRQWFSRTPDRALDQAYEAALKIRQIEDTHFGGNPVAEGYGTLSRSSYRLLQKDLKKYLSIINRRMAEFRASSSMTSVSEMEPSAPLPEDVPLNQINGPAIFFSKLQLVDEVLERYRQPSLLAQTGLSLGPLQSFGQSFGQSLGPGGGNLPALPNDVSAKAKDDNSNEGLSNSSNVLPRSILRTVDRIKQDLDPDAEVEVVRSFRSSKVQTTVAITFVLQLIIIPLLAQYLSKNFVIGPIVDRGRDITQAEVFLNEEMEEDALHELQKFEERFRFEVLIGKAPEMNEIEIENRVRQKAFQIEEEYRHRSADAVKNVFADVIAVLTFSLLLTTFKQKDEISIGG
ncbi:MAG: proton extrusion protein PcxA [Cyanobacteria bacterium J06597_16]